MGGTPTRQANYDQPFDRLSKLIRNKDPYNFLLCKESIAFCLLLTPSAIPLEMNGRKDYFEN